MRGFKVSNGGKVEVCMATRSIDRIIIENFQSHKKSIINLAGPGNITAICGASDVGKSSIIKAVELLLTGKWDASYLRYGARNLSITSEYSDGCTLTYKRSKSGSPAYVIRHPDGQEQVFEGFGRTVPPEVIALTGVRPITLGDSTFLLNVQRQDAGPFMGPSVSAPGRARILGALAWTEEVDAAVRMLSNQLTKDRQERVSLAGDPGKQTVGEIGMLDGQLKEYEYLDSFGENIERVKGLLGRIQQDQAMRDKLSSLWNQLVIVRREANKAEQEWFNSDDLIVRIEPGLIGVERDNLLLKTLATYLEQMKAIEADRSIQGDIVRATEGLPDTMDKLSAAERDAVTQGSLQTLNQSLQRTWQDTQKEREVVSLTEGVDAATAKIQSLVADSAMLADLLSLSEKMRQSRAALGEVGKTIEDTQRVPDALIAAEATRSDNEAYEKLFDLWRKKVKVRVEILGVSDTLKATEGIAEAMELLTEAGASVSTKEEQVDEVGRLIDVTERQAATAEDGYFRLLKEMGVCELCGSEVHEENLRRVLR